MDFLTQPQSYVRVSVAPRRVHIMNNLRLLSFFVKRGGGMLYPPDFISITPSAEISIKGLFLS